MMSGGGLSYWRPDDGTRECELCLKQFSFRTRRHHCRDCGGVFCSACTARRFRLPYRGFPTTPVRVCIRCAPLADALVGKVIAEPVAEPTNVSFGGYLANYQGYEPGGADKERWNKIKSGYGRAALRGVPNVTASTERVRRMLAAAKLRQGQRSGHDDGEGSIADDEDTAGDAENRDAPITDVFGFEPTDRNQSRQSLLASLGASVAAAPALLPADFCGAGIIVGVDVIAMFSEPLVGATVGSTNAAASFCRLRDGFSIAHRNATEAQPQELPRISGVPIYA